MGLNWLVLLYEEFFSIVNTELYHPSLVESADAEPQIQGPTLGLEHPRILVTMAGPRTNPLWIPRDDCISVDSVLHRKRNT